MTDLRKLLQQVIMSIKFTPIYLSTLCISVLILSATCIVDIKAFAIPELRGSQSQDICDLPNDVNTSCDKSVQPQKQIVAVTQAKRKIIAGNFTFLFKYCGRENGDIFCSFKYKYTQPKGKIVFNNAKIVDQSGLSYPARLLTTNGYGYLFGDTRDITGSISYDYDVKIFFKGVPQQVNKLQEFRININNINVVFQDISTLY